MTLLTQNHLLYWIFKAVDAGVSFRSLDDMVDPKLAETIGAPAWFAGNMAERLKDYKMGTSTDQRAPRVRSSAEPNNLDVARAALRGMVDEFERTTRQGSPMAIDANPRYRAALDALAATEPRPGA